MLIHDAQHTAEVPSRSFLGHSAVEYAVGLAAIDALVAAHAGGTVEVIGGTEGLAVDV